MPTDIKIRRFADGDALHVQAQRIWIILVALAQGHRLFEGVSPRQQSTITYGELAHMMGKSSQAGITLMRQLFIVGEYCKMNDLPCLNALVVQSTGKKRCGEGVVLSDGVMDDRVERRAVLKFDWFQVGVPSTGTLRRVYAERRPAPSAAARTPARQEARRSTPGASAVRRAVGGGEGSVAV